MRHRIFKQLNGWNVIMIYSCGLLVEDGQAVPRFSLAKHFWQIHEATAINSASVVDKVTNSCFLEDQDTAHWGTFPTIYISYIVTIRVSYQSTFLSSCTCDPKFSHTSQILEIPLHRNQMHLGRSLHISADQAYNKHQVWSGCTKVHQTSDHLLVEGCIYCLPIFILWKFATWYYRICQRYFSPCKIVPDPQHFFWQMKNPLCILS